MNKIYPMYAAPEKGIPYHIGSTIKIPPMPLLWMPDGIVQAPADVVMPDLSIETINQFTFYCNSYEKSNHGIECLDEPNPNTNEYCRVQMDARGDGTQENPWVDLNYALLRLCCIARTACSPCFNLKLVLSGNVNYMIGYIDQHLRGYGGILVDCSAAVFNPKFDDYDLFGEIGHWACFVGLDGINFENVAIDANSHVNVDFSIFSRCRDCFVSFRSVKYHQHFIQDGKHYTWGHASLISHCHNCRFTGASLDMNMEYHTPLGPGDYAVGHNTWCFFDTSTNIEISQKKDLPASPFLGEVFGFLRNLCCTFSSCKASLSVSITKDQGGDADRDDMVEGCGFYGNAGTTWIGENIGYCRKYDEENEKPNYTPNCTVNSNCDVFPAISSGASLCPSLNFPRSSHGPSISWESSSESSSSNSSSSSLSSSSTSSSSFGSGGSGSGSGGSGSGSGGDNDGDDTRGTVRVLTTWRHFAFESITDFDTEDSGVENRQLRLYVCYNKVSKQPQTTLGYANDIGAANADIVDYWNGKFVPVPSSDKFELGIIPENDDPDAFYGWREWYISEQREYFFHTKDQQIDIATNFKLNWYSAWGDPACSYPVTAYFALQTIMFQWQPAVGEEEIPDKVLITTPSLDKLWLDFDVEYFLMSQDLPDINNLLLASCPPVEGEEFSLINPKMSIGREYDQTIDDMRFHGFIYQGCVFDYKG